MNWNGAHLQTCLKINYENAVSQICTFSSAIDLTVSIVYNDINKFVHAYFLWKIHENTFGSIIKLLPMI